MNNEMILRFLNKNVKLVKESFVLYGRIIDISDDYIIFQTSTKTSMIHLDVIKEITPID